LDLTPTGGSLLNRDSVNGAVVVWVDPQGPANPAGILAGDVIVTIDKTPINDASELYSYFKWCNPDNKTVTLHIIRDTLEKDITVEKGWVTETERWVIQQNSNTLSLPAT
jgi:S1-C subfamily serine protease